MEDVVSLVDKRNVVLDGNGAMLFATTSGYRERALLSLVGGFDLTVRELSLRGANPNGGENGIYNPNLEGQHGIRLWGPERVLIEGNTITDVWGDFLYLGRDLRKSFPTWLKSSTDVTVRGNKMARNGRQGIAITQASRVLVTGNDISDVRRTMFDLEPNGPSWLVEDVTIADNVVGSPHLNFLSAAGRGPVNDVAVLRNQLHGTPMNSMIKNRLGNSRRNWTFAGNVSDRAFGSPLRGVIVAYGVEGLNFVDNVQPMKPRRNMVGVQVYGGCGAVATGNTMVNSLAQLGGTTSPCLSALMGSGVDLPASVSPAP